MWRDFIQEHALQRPGHVALVDRPTGQVFNYSQLAAHIERLARHLAARGLRPGDRVVLLAPNRLEHVTLFFATIRLGAILAPIDPRLAPQELDAILADLEPALGFADPPRPGFATFDTLLGDPGHADLPRIPIEDDRVLMILHTSGSSGRPKGVMFHAAMLMANIANTLDADVLRREDISIVNTPYFHTGGYNVFCLPMLSVGGTLLLHARFDPGLVLREIDQAGVTVFWAVPTMFQAMFDHPDFPRTDFSRIRFFLSGGAPLGLNLIQGYHRHGVPFKQGFGLTEVGPNCFLLETADAFAHPDSIGKPMAHSKVRVVDDRGHPVGVDAVGEMWIAGPHVCKGYWRNDRFFAESMRGGFFATGDLVRVDRDGFYHVIGRKKEMYISGGENVYPGEVEKQIATHPAVDQVVVVGVPDPRWGETGLAFCVTHSPLDLEGLRKHLDSRLARYKHPRHLRILSAMPLLANGKIDRPALKRLGVGGDPDACYRRGVDALRAGRPHDAVELIGQAMELGAGVAAYHANLGLALQAVGRLEEAVEACRRAVQLQPGLLQARLNLGSLLGELQRYAEAEAILREILRVLPDHADVHFNLGRVLSGQQRFDEAEAAFRESLRLRPASPDAAECLAGVLLQRGNRLKGQGHHAEAEAVYREAVGVAPDPAEAYHNLGVLFSDLCRHAEAEAAFHQALRARPNFPEALVNLGMLLLRQGNFDAGWPLYESRRLAPGHPNISAPPWRGEDPAGKTILVVAEQGFGDTIQFCRYLPLLAARGARSVILLCQPPLLELLRTLAGAPEWLVLTAMGGAGGGYCDYWTRLLSLPGLFRTTLATLPDTLPYLSASPQRLALWESRLPAAPFRVGLAWRGSPTHVNDRNRSLPEARLLAPLWSVPGVTFIALQTGGEEVAPTPEPPMLDPGGSVRDFADVAAIVAQLDLVICVDTALAHLCGALHKPCWVLLPAIGPDWRWLEHRTDSPWYPKVIRIWRGEYYNGWSAMIYNIKETLLRVTAQ
ncbi:MAG: AMP-binding protein [Magnetococcales bacterium]|nr:AMP-binding protein [Magnetococcales bacterium]